MIKPIFNNIENELSAKITDAENYINVAVAWFTNDTLLEHLSNALKRGVKVKVLITDDIINRCEFDLNFGMIAEQGADVRFSKSVRGTMHNKFCIIDNVVISGSYNWTYHANINSENVIITDETSIVNSYREEFEKLFNQVNPIALPYERLKWTDIKEGDFSEMRRSIFKDVIAQNDENRDLKRVKLISLDHAYKSGTKDELEKTGLLPTTGRLKTITDVLTAKSRDYEFRLWEENITGKPYDNVDGHCYIGKWYYVPYSLKEDKYHREYIEGTLKTNAGRDCVFSKGLT